MDIKTKFKLGDLGWLMEDNKPKSFPIDKIEITVRESYHGDCKTVITYFERGVMSGHREEDLCVSKEELKRRVFDENA